MLTGSTNVSVVETGDAVAFSLTGPVPDSWKPQFGVPAQPGAQVLQVEGDNAYVVRVLTGSANVSVVETGDAVAFSLTGNVPES